MRAAAWLFESHKKKPKGDIYLFSKYELLSINENAISPKGIFYIYQLDRLVDKIRVRLLVSYLVVHVTYYYIAV